MGGEIFTHLRRAGTFKESHTKFYAATVLCALQHMHDRCIAYRDLKPENLVLDDMVRTCSWRISVCVLRDAWWRL